MKIPQRPPVLESLLSGLKDPARLAEIMSLSSADQPRDYPHWDKVRRYAAPPGFTREEWWLALKISRLGLLKPIALVDKEGRPFKFCVPPSVQEELHEIDLGTAGTAGAPEPIVNPETRNLYLMRSLMEEAITSSQLEGAATTREVAKEMIRTGRKPRDTSEQMILNNYVTMQRIATLKSKPLSPETVFAIHRLVTDKTLDDPTAAGRFRRADERRVVGSDAGEVYHDPPLAGELESRLAAMCDFANGQTPDFFVHPAIRAILLHFWLAYDHAFIDGNGRTARALFYWCMLRNGYWMFEFISISHILRKAPVQYGRSFLYTETDDNDLTYFIAAQIQVIREGIEGLHAYVNTRAKESRELGSHLRALALFNHRQVALIGHALKHPSSEYNIAGHRASHKTVYQTARADLLDLKRRGLLRQIKRGKQMVFLAPPNLAERLRKLESRNRG